MKKGSIIKKSFVLFIVLSLFIIPASSIETKNKLQNNLPFDNISADFGMDIKAKITGGDWQDDSLTAFVGNEINFELNLESSGGGILVVVLFPIIGGESMFKYKTLSGSHIPEINDESVLMWGFVGGAPDKITFTAYLMKEGTGNVDASICDVAGEETSDDTIQVTGEGGGCCFPAGTKITMYDGTCKNIEDVKIGDRVLSYNTESGKYDSWFVKMLGTPIHPVYSINNGLIKLTVDHPVFVKKSEKIEGIGAIDALRASNSIVLTDSVLKLEIGDKLLDKDGKYIEIDTITASTEAVQTYNILSFSGTRTFFANGILVYEEHPKNAFRNVFLENILELMPNFTSFLLRTKIFQRIFS